MVNQSQQNHAQTQEKLRDLKKEKKKIKPEKKSWNRLSLRQLQPRKKWKN
jgi:hypothetical protein